MSNKTKLSTSVAAVALAAAVLVGGGTFAYLKAESDTVTNKFNPNTVKVELNEESGTDYEIIPGTTVTKDPKVTVTNTTDAYVFVTVTDETYQGGKDGQDLVDWDYAKSEGWQILEGEQDGEFILWMLVGENPDGKTYDIIEGNEITYSEDIENEDMYTDEDNTVPWIQKAITFKAYAIQAVPFKTAANTDKEGAIAAWTELKGNMVSVSYYAADDKATTVSKKVLNGKEITVSGNTITIDGTEYETLATKGTDKFTGWADGNGNPVKDGDEVSGGMTISPVYEEITYTVTVDGTDVKAPIGATITVSDNTITIGTAEPITAAKTNNGAIFLGWKDSDGNTVKTDDTVTSDMTIDPVYGYTVTVNYSADGNAPTAATPITVPAGTTIAVDGQKLTVGTTEYTSYANAPEGDFKRWEYSTDGGTTYAAITEGMTVTDDMTIRAAYGYIVTVYCTREAMDNVIYEMVCAKDTKMSFNGNIVTIGDKSYTTVASCYDANSGETYYFEYWVTNTEPSGFGNPVSDGSKTDITTDLYMAGSYTTVKH